MSRTTQRFRLTAGAAVVTLLAAGLAGVGTPARAATPQRGTPTTATPSKSTPPADPVSAAVKQARADGEPVQIPSLLDEYTTTSANPDGTLTQTYSTAPQRVRQGTKWVPIDTTLVKQKDGSYAPKATLSTLSVSSGGGTGLLTMRDGSRSLKFSWPKKLPAPKIDGDTATYANVYPGVDLQIIADATGYSSMFVVKNAQAAIPPTIDFGLSGTGVELGTTKDGGAEAKDPKSGEAIFHTGSAVMWDSTPSTGETAAEVAKMDARTAAGRIGANRSKIAVGIKGGRQSLTLDQKLLTAKTTKFPVYVDPYWSGNPSQIKWARISSNGWNVYNSTSKTGSTSARIGYDNWPESGGAGERAKTYYQMNTSGIKGAEIFEANLYVTERWAASCSNTAAVVYGTAAPSGWGSGSLYWGHEPGKATGVLSTVNGRELDCGKKTIRVSPASLKFNVLSYVKTIAKGNKANATFVVQAKDMDDKYSWKQLGYGGGATLSVKYSYKPKLLNGTGSPKTTPSIVDQGKNVTTTHTPTLTAYGVNPKVNKLQENVRIEYQVFKGATRVLTGYSGYSLNGGAYRTASLADGTYTWKATVQNASGLWAGVYTATQTMVIDTVAPKAPTVRSSQFPPNILGGAYTDKGTFAFGNDKTNNVTGYLFGLDIDLANTVYATNKGTQWTATTVLKANTIYFAKADNAGGTGTVVVNGTAGVQFAPITAGAHRLFAKAVDQAGSTSPQTAYAFSAGIQTPSFTYGKQLVSGATFTNSDGTTTTTPAATKVSAKGQIISQAAAWLYFGDGYQLVLSDTSSTAKVAQGDKATMYFNVPATGAWEIGANLTTGSADGIWDITLDSGQATQKTLLTGFDGYQGANGSPRFVHFGVVKDAAGKPMTLNKGAHSITFTMTGKNAASTGYQAGIDLLRISPLPICTIDNTATCLNNASTSTLTEGTTPTITVANADGPGSSIEAADLKAAGWTAGSTVTVNGAKIKLPGIFGTGAKDNMMANGQVVNIPTSGVVNKGNALVFVGFATDGPTNDSTGTINYASTSCGLNSQSFTLSTMPDWTNNTQNSDAVLTLPRYNKSNATRVATALHIFSVTVPLQCPGAVVESVVLPVVTGIPQYGVDTLHLFGMGIRPSSAGDSAHWVGTWSAAQDTDVVNVDPNDAPATLNGQTLRIPLRVSLGTAGATQQIRVRLSNARGKTPVTFGAASIALQDGTTEDATAAGTPSRLTFSGSTTTTLVPGTEVLSDPVTLSVSERSRVLVSIKVNGTVTAVPGHKDPRLPIWTSAPDSVDHTGELGAGNFTLSPLSGLPYVAGLDVTTSASDPAGALVLLGDQTINSDTAGQDGYHQFDERLADFLADADDGNGKVPFGVLNQGSSSWGNRVKLPNTSTTLAQSALTDLDRSVFSQANVRTALISAGSTDLLACTGTADACSAPVIAKLSGLAAQIGNFKTDDSSNTGVVLPNPSGNIKVYVATLPPFTGTHTAVQESAREMVNAAILDSNLSGYADGVINFAAAVSTEGDENSDTVGSDYLWDDGAGHLWPSDVYYEQLAWEYLASSDRIDRVSDETGTHDGDDSVAVWNFDEGTGTVAKDTGIGVPAGTTHNATLTNVAWGTGRMLDSKAGTFNGTSSYGTTDYKVNTAKSFSVAAWVKLSDKTTDRTVFARGSTGWGSLYLQYNKAEDRWLAQMPSATAGGDEVKWFDALSDSVPQAGVWTHLAATYDADLSTLTLYVNGAAETLIEEVTPFNDTTGSAYIGRAGTNWFAGDIADVRIWARAVNAGEVDQRSAAEPIADYEFEDDSVATVAKDSTFHGNDATFDGGAAYEYPGRSGWDIGALHLNGTDATVSRGPLLRTDQSFTVAAWVRLDAATWNHAIVSQEGAHVGRFSLHWSVESQAWQFTLCRTDTAAPETDAVVGPTMTAPPIGVWTHVAGVYDAAAGTMVLYINGEPVATKTEVPLSPWQAGGSFLIGRSRWDDHVTDYFPGAVDSVRVYQGAATEDLINELIES
ncbi:LamG-like jellyroll fold domain-containing protein [Actinoplanes sp. NPDC026619]|uniref:LamG-like jellyroll fold domain-containing protein n=1 Tax=Actinoplanes sp. NPDC026619 TaxID=3155798 RepID=UPI003409F61F